MRCFQLPLIDSATSEIKLDLAFIWYRDSTKAFFKEAETKDKIAVNRPFYMKPKVTKQPKRKEAPQHQVWSAVHSTNKIYWNLFYFTFLIKSQKLCRSTRNRSSWDNVIGLKQKQQQVQFPHYFIHNSMFLRVLKLVYGSLWRWKLQTHR